VQYSILIFGVEGVFDQLSQQEQDSVMQGHYDLQDTLASKGVEYTTAKLMPGASAVTIKPTSGTKEEKPIVRDGPFSETKEQFLGFYTVECDSLDEVIELANHISSPIVTLEIRPIAWAGGALNNS